MKEKLERENNEMSVSNRLDFSKSRRERFLSTERARTQEKKKKERYTIGAHIKFEVLLFNARKIVG